MIRQLSMTGLRIRTPSLIEELNVYSEVSHQYFCNRFVVTEELVIELKSPCVGATFSNVEVDVVGSVKTVPFAVYCSYPGRDVPESLCQPDIELSGVIEISLVGIAQRFRHVVSGRYVDALRSYIEESSEGKFWIYHPRYKRKKEQTEIENASWLSQQKPRSRVKKDFQSEETIAPKKNMQASSMPNRRARSYKCIICGNQWHGISRNCTACKTHLYTTESGMGGDET